MTFGRKLHEWRKAKGLTQHELALAVGVNVSYISNLERDFSATTKSGRPRPSETLCEKFSKVLGIPLDDVRLAARYAPLNETQSFNIGEKARIALLDQNLTPEEQREIAEEMALAYRIVMERRRERALRDNE